MSINRKLVIGAAGAAAFLAAAGAAAAEPSFEIRHAAARVVVIPENRSDIKVEIVSSNAALPLELERRGDDVVLEGDLRRRISSCKVMFGKTTVHVRGHGEVTLEDLPQVVVRTPMKARVGASGAVFGSVGRSEALELSNAGCGDWTVANVKGQLRVNQAGSGDTRVGRSGSFAGRIAGSGSVMAKEVDGPASIDIAGSGDVVVASVSGPLRANIAGSGDIRIDGGEASEVTVRIAGSGDVRFAGTAGDVHASVAGSGDVAVGKVTGQVTKSIIGSGDVTVGG